MSELSEMRWNEWFEGIDLNEPYEKVPMVDRRCPYESDLSESNGKVPMSWEWMSLSIWLDWSQWESPYVQLNECPYQSDLEQPYGNLPMVRRGWTLWEWLEWSQWESPYQNDQNRWEMNELKWIEWIEVKWVNGWKWLGTTIWESPYGRLRVSLSKWLEMSDLIKPFQNDQNRWEMNEMKWIEWIEVKWVIWWIWLCEPYEKVPMSR